MKSKINAGIVVIIILLLFTDFGQLRMNQAGFGMRRSSTVPPLGNDRQLRELSAEEIPPNLNYYAMDPLYNPDAVLG